MAKQTYPAHHKSVKLKTQSSKRIGRDSKIKLKAGMEKSKSDFVLAYSTYNSGEVPLIKSILNSENIEHFTINEDGNVLYAPIGIDIMVIRDKAGEAKELLKDFINKTNSIS